MEGGHGRLSGWFDLRRPLNFIEPRESLIDGNARRAGQVEAGDEVFEAHTVILNICRARRAAAPYR